MRFSGTGNLIDSQVHTESAGSESDTDARNWSGTANLSWGNPVLGGGVGYSRSDTRATISAANLITAAGLGRGNVNETWSAFARWRPLDLPYLEGRVARSTDRAVDRRLNVFQATVDAGYVPVRPVDLHYTLGYTDTHDQLSGVTTTNVGQSGRATYTDELFGRSSVYLAYNVAHSAFETEAPGQVGTVSLQRSPVAGLSLVEPFGSVPESDTLQPNPAVIDGNLAASTGMNIGFAPTLAGDTSLREVGSQLSDATQPVNTLHVWVNRALPAAVSAAYSWSVYRSDDNLTWAPVPIVRGVVFGVAANRFEITIEEIRARYVKVAVAPLSPSVAADPTLQNVLVTELQSFLVVPAAAVLGRTTSLRDSAAGTISTRILSSPRLRHDLAFTTSRETSSPASWLLTNGLSLSHRLTRIVGVSARAARSDSSSGDTHVGQWLYSGSVTAEPTPTLSSVLSLSGTVTQADVGTTVSNGASAFARARLYEGVEANSNLSYRIRPTPATARRAARSPPRTPPSPLTGSSPSRRAPGPHVPTRPGAASPMRPGRVAGSI